MPATGNKYLSSKILTDPWGNIYCYDDNYKEKKDPPPYSCDLPSVLWSMGPDGIRQTPQQPFPGGFQGDDIGIVINEPQC